MYVYEELTLSRVYLFAVTWESNLKATVSATKLQKTVLK